MQKKSPIWLPIPKDYTIGNIVLKSEFNKKTHKRYLIATADAIIMFKDNEFKKPCKYLPLDFETKFEVTRTAPKLKNNLSPVKLSANARVDQVKSENIIQLGDLQTMLFLREDDFDKKYEVRADADTLKRWRLYLGTKINQIGFHHLFKVYKKIGKGNFASVYLAERVEDGQQMAIKAFSKSVAYAEESGKEGLINEINLMRQLDHPNIIKLYEVHETSNSVYMGLELLEGGQLYEYLKKKVIFQNKEIQIIIKGLLQGLRHIHSKDIMHRDIKLENILFKKQNSIDSVVLADFGLATNVNESVYLYCRCGTPGFVAPEVINIKDLKTRYDKVCDVYSLGLVFHLLITGKPAFQGKSYTTIVNQNKEAKIQFKSSIFEIIPKPALELMKMMLEVDPTKRISAEDALKHPYFDPLKLNLSQFDDEPIDTDDSSPLESRLNKINEVNNKFDMLRINQLTNSPIKSPNMRATQTSAMKDSVTVDNQDQLVMHTPVITGRIDSIDDSPQDRVPQLQMEQSKKRHQRQESLSYLQKFSKQQEEGQQSAEKGQFEQQGEGKELNIQAIKQSLSKNV